MYGVRDQQRSKVYNWERTTLTDFYRKELTLKECDILIHKALVWWFRNDAIREVRIKDGRGTRNATGGYYAINLPTWARGKHVVLHEVAHTIVSRTGGLKDGGHGPYFMRVFIELLGHFLKYDRAELTRSAKRAKVKVKPVKYLKRPVLSNRNYRPVMKRVR